MKFAQLHYFLSQTIGGDKRYYVHRVQKLGRHVPHKLGPCSVAYFLRISVFYEFIRNALSNTCLVFDIAVQVCDHI